MPAALHFGTLASDGSLTRRQYVEDGDGRDVWFWYTTPGIIIKYVVFLVILFGLLAWVVGGRIHAKRRLVRGQKPLGYHAWLLSRRERALVDPAYRWPQATYYGVYRPGYGQPNNPNNNNNGDGEYYGMHSMPPPMYDPSRPPVYEGPPPPGAGAGAAGTKVDPAQQGRREGDNNSNNEEYAPPAGPPPAVYR